MTLSPEDFPAQDDLVNRVLKRDREALAELFEQARDRLRKIASFRLDPRLASRVDVEDILQEAYLNAEQRLSHVMREATGGIFVWLRLILNQTLADVHRRHLGAQARDASRDRSSSQVIGAGLSSNMGDSNAFSFSSMLLGHLTSPSQALLRKELTEQLDTAIQSMNELDREILILRHFEELTNLETARLLGISEQGASVRYVRALVRLQHILEAIPE